MIFNGFIERLQVEIPSILMGMAFSPPEVVRNDISTPLGENYDLVPQVSNCLPWEWEYHSFPLKELKMLHLP